MEDWCFFVADMTVCRIKSAAFRAGVLPLLLQCLLNFLMDHLNHQVLLLTKIEWICLILQIHRMLTHFCSNHTGDQTFIAKTFNGIKFSIMTLNQGVLKYSACCIFLNINPWLTLRKWFTNQKRIHPRKSSFYLSIWLNFYESYECTL